MLNTYQRQQQVGEIKLYKTYILVDEIKLDPSNPRNITDIKKKDLDYFIDKYELLAPLLVDGRPEKEGQLLGGNNRFERYKAKGKTEVWIEVRAPRDDAEAFEIATISNMQFATYVKQLLVELTRRHSDVIDVGRLSVPLAPETNMRDLLNKISGKSAEDEAPAVDNQTPPPQCCRCCLSARQTSRHVRECHTTYGFRAVDGGGKG